MSEKTDREIQKEARIAELAKWTKPFGQGRRRQFHQLEEYGFMLLGATKEHRACLDCEHARVNGSVNRACAMRPDVHLWFMDADVEMKEFQSTVEYGFEPNVDGADAYGCKRTEHLGETMADACPHFQLCSILAANPTAYRDEIEVIMSEAPDEAR